MMEKGKIIFEKISVDMIDRLQLFCLGATRRRNQRKIQQYL